jgi:hypothetical protein
MHLFPPAAGAARFRAHPASHAVHLATTPSTDAALAFTSCTAGYDCPRPVLRAMPIDPRGVVPTVARQIVLVTGSPIAQGPGVVPAFISGLDSKGHRLRDGPCLGHFSLLSCDDIATLPYRLAIRDLSLRLLPVRCSSQVFISGLQPCLWTIRVVPPRSYLRGSLIRIAVAGSPSVSKASCTPAIGRLCPRFAGS